MDETPLWKKLTEVLTDWYQNTNLKKKKRNVLFCSKRVLVRLREYSKLKGQETTVRTRTRVAPATNLPQLPGGQCQEDFREEAALVQIRRTRAEAPGGPMCSPDWPPTVLLRNLSGACVATTAPSPSGGLRIKTVLALSHSSAGVSCDGNCAAAVPRGCSSPACTKALAGGLRRSRGERHRWGGP